MENEKYLCTDEREQVRRCTREDCDDPSRGTEYRLGGETRHIWTPLGSDGIEVCSVCGYERGDLAITYVPNVSEGDPVPTGLTAAGEERHDRGTDVTLWQPTGETAVENVIKDGHWIRTVDEGKQAIFVGWSLKDYGETLVASGKDIPFCETVNIDKDQTSSPRVYAVWAADFNENLVPDYDEHTLTYDPNGGYGPVPTGILPTPKGETFSLAKAEEVKLLKDNAVFMGWSLKKNDKDLATPEDEEASGLIHSFQLTVGDEDVTVYAVWGADMNGNGTADLNEGNISLPMTPQTAPRTETICPKRSLFCPATAPRLRLCPWPVSPLRARYR